MNLALFSSYSKYDFIHNYVKFYLENLSKNFDKVILLTNERIIKDYDIEFLEMIGVDLMLVKNEGFDFGMWYKGIMSIDISDINLLGLFNDSCILFDDPSDIFNSIKSSKENVFGITDSKEFHHHLQSYFLVFKGDCIKEVYNYFKLNGIIKDDEVRSIIQVYEVGLSKYLINKGYKVIPFYKQDDYNKKNISLLCAYDLISHGCPLIKKKMVTNNFRDHEISWLKNEGYDFSKNYINLIKNKIKNKTISIDYLLEKIVKL